MHHALNLPITGEYSDPRLVAELAREAEHAGWDGIFVWDILLFNPERIPAVTDPWMTLAVIAMYTEHVKIGPMAAMLAHRRPWKVAREIVALDHLSGGRMILGVGLEHAEPDNFAQSGAGRSQKTPTSKLDEALEIITGLCSGEPFGYDGEHYQLKEIIFLPRPVQERIPIWVAGWWPNQVSMQQVARWDGAYLVESKATDSSQEAVHTSPDTVRVTLAFINEQRTKTGPFDMTISRSLWHEEPATARKLAADFAEAGATWIIQDVLPWEVSPEQARELIRQGPPKI